MARCLLLFRAIVVQRLCREKPSSLSVVVPAYNEARRLEDSLPPLLDLVTDAQAELIVVDDGSEDGTSAVAAAHLAGVPRAKLLRLALNRSSHRRPYPSPAPGPPKGPAVVSVGWIGV